MDLLSVTLPGAYDSVSELGRRTAALGEGWGNKRQGVTEGAGSPPLVRRRGLT